MAIKRISTSKLKRNLPIPEESRPSKHFEIVPLDIYYGQKIAVYGDTGIGKTSLAFLAPNPVFLDLDEGGSKIRHPKTGKPIPVVKGIGDYSDVRAALGQVELFEDYQTIVIDNVTILQGWAEDYLVKNIPTEKGTKVKNILGYGYNKGYKHLYNVMKDILADLDMLIRNGKNVILIAQSAIHNVPNPGGEDFYRAGLRLHVDKSWDIEGLYCEWCDHVLRVAYLNTFVKHKKVSGTTERAVFVLPEVHFRAKSRSLREPIVSYESPADDSIWQFIFGEKNNE